jgi:hypothetical protein
MNLVALGVGFIIIAVSLFVGKQSSTGQPLNVNNIPAGNVVHLISFCKIQ